MCAREVGNGNMWDRVAGGVRCGRICMAIYVFFVCATAPCVLLCVALVRKRVNGNAVNVSVGTQQRVTYAAA